MFNFVCGCKLTPHFSHDELGGKNVFRYRWYLEFLIHKIYWKKSLVYGKTAYELKHCGFINVRVGTHL